MYICPISWYNAEGNRVHPLLPARTTGGGRGGGGFIGEIAVISFTTGEKVAIGYKSLYHRLPLFLSAPSFFFFYGKTDEGSRLTFLFSPSSDHKNIIPPPYYYPTPTPTLYNHFATTPLPPCVCIYVYTLSCIIGCDACTVCCCSPSYSSLA